jgi:cytochrome c553
MPATKPLARCLVLTEKAIAALDEYYAQSDPSASTKRQPYPESISTGFYRNSRQFTLTEKAIAALDEYYAQEEDES